MLKSLARLLKLMLFSFLMLRYGVLPDDEVRLERTQGGIASVLIGLRCYVFLGSSMAAGVAGVLKWW